MIPEDPETSDAPPGRAPGAAGPAAADKAREIDELTFLVGTSCSRTITLLMQADADREVVREELAFLAEKAGRLALLLS